MKLKEIIKTQKQIEEMGYRIENNIIEVVDINTIAHFGNVTCFEIGCTNVYPMSAYNNINNLGYIVKTNQNAIAKHGSSLFQGKSLDGFGVNNDDDFKQDRLAVLGIEDADHNLSKNEEDLFKDLYKFIDGKFKQRDIDIFNLVALIV